MENDLIVENLNLSDLSLKELQQLKKDWWDNSLKEEIHKKLELITQTLGRQIILFASLEYSYQTEKLIVRCKYASHEGLYSLEAYYKNKLVYSRVDKLFVPGDWTSVVDSLYNIVTDKERQHLIEQLTTI
jgi:hypothetical protein